MKILVINSGSSSIKYQLFDMEHHRRLASGLVEKIGEENSCHTYKFADEKIVKEHPIPDHGQGLSEIINMLTAGEQKAINATSEIVAVGHRVVHGGDHFHNPTLINDEVTQEIRNNIPLAPLHNPANLSGIEVSRKLFPGVPQVAVFDTAFHQTMPNHVYNYALPKEVCDELRIRRYGFHGTSHSYVAKAAAKYLNKPLSELNLITAHLGNGASITAILNGKSYDTSMGLTPLEGLIMGTRCGDLDPAIHFYIAKQKQMDMDKVETLLTKQSGVKGICSVNDMREIEDREQKGDVQAKLALDMYAYRVKKYIGAYTAALGRLDVLIFTAGVGENSPIIRERSCRGLENLGIALDTAKNDVKARKIIEIHGSESKTKILVVPTNEELEIAQQTQQIVSQ